MIEVAPLLADASVRVVSEFVAQAGDITAMVFSPTGDLLATSGHDAVISFWKVGDGTRAFSIEHEGTPWSLDFSISGDVLMVPSGLTGRLFTYAMDLDILLRDAAFQVTRGFTENECLQFLLVDSCADAPPGTPGIGDSED